MCRGKLSQVLLKVKHNVYNNAETDSTAAEVSIHGRIEM